MTDWTPREKVAMSKHTPGPWHLFERNYLCVESASGNIALCNLARDSKADARLIAAAPELLSALQDMVENMYCLCDSHIYNALDAIAKATGEQR